MTRHNLPKTLLAASAFLVLAAAAPAAMAAPAVKAKAKAVNKSAVTKVAALGDRNRANRSALRNNNRGTRTRGTNRTTRSAARTTNRNNNRSVARNVERNVSVNRSNNRSNLNVNRAVNRTVNRNRNNVVRNASVNRNNNFRSGFNNSRISIGSSSFGGFRNNYRSSFGISFSFGSPGFSRYRWAPSSYGFYRPSYGSYRSYTASTFCDRVLLNGYQYGRGALISVVQCSNPWDGSYILQGTEQIVRFL